MIANRFSPEYWNSVEEFIKFVVEHADNPNHIKCPCIKCVCVDKVTIEVLKDHLFINEIDQNYTG